MTCVCITEQMQRHTENVVWRWRQRQQQCFYKPRHVKNCCYKKLEGCGTDSSWVPRRNQTCQQLWFWVSSLKNYERISSVVLSHLCVCCAQLLSRVQLFAPLWTVVSQVPPSMVFSRQEYWSGLPFPPPGDLPDPGIEPTSSALAGGFFTTVPPGKPL